MFGTLVKHKRLNEKKRNKIKRQRRGGGKREGATWPSSRLGPASLHVNRKVCCGHHWALSPSTYLESALQSVNRSPETHLQFFKRRSEGNSREIEAEESVEWKHLMVMTGCNSKGALHLQNYRSALLLPGGVEWTERGANTFCSPLACLDCERMSLFNVNTWAETVFQWYSYQIRRLNSVKRVGRRFRPS